MFSPQRNQDRYKINYIFNSKLILLQFIKKKSLMQSRDFRVQNGNFVELKMIAVQDAYHIYHTSFILMFHSVKFEHIFDSAVETDATTLHNGYHFIIMSSCQFYDFYFGFSCFQIHGLSF